MKFTELVESEEKDFNAKEGGAKQHSPRAWTLGQEMVGQTCTLVVTVDNPSAYTEKRISGMEQWTHWTAVVGELAILVQTSPRRG